MVAKQLFLFFLCPALFAAVIAGIVAVYVSALFVSATGVKTPAVQYYGTVFALFFGVYVVYFAATCIGFLRNVYASSPQP